MIVRIISLLGRACLALIIMLGSAWMAGAIWHQAPGPQALHIILAAIAILLALAAIVGVFRRRWRMPAAFLAALTLSLIWWSTIAPSNDRIWSPEMARNLTYQRDGDIITISNVRNFYWTSISEAQENWETRSYDLTRVTGIDVYSLYWMGPAIGHTYFSFTFEGGEALSFSVEIRKELGEPYSPVAGFFKGFELAVLAGDERDFVGWRIYADGEDIQMFRTNATPAEARALLLALLDKANALAAQPEFYNTLTANCTTAVWSLTSALGAGLPLDSRVILSGYLPDYLYAQGRLDSSRPLTELRAAGNTIPRARAALQAGLEGTGFSTALRDGVPQP